LASNNNNNNNNNNITTAILKIAANIDRTGTKPFGGALSLVRLVYLQTT